MVNKAPLEIFAGLCGLILLFGLAVGRKDNLRGKKWVLFMLLFDMFMLFFDAARQYVTAYALSLSMSGEALYQDGLPGNLFPGGFTLPAIFASFLYSLAFSCLYGVIYSFTRFLFQNISLSISAWERKEEKTAYPFFWITLFSVFLLYTPLLASFLSGLPFSTWLYGTALILSRILMLAVYAYDIILSVKNAERLGLRYTAAVCCFGLAPLFPVLFQTNGFEETEFFLTISLCMELVYVMLHVERRKELLEKEAEIKKNRISIMMGQIQPHFLYNALNSIYHLCAQDPEKAAVALQGFSQYIKANMESLQSMDLVPFSKELEHVKSYLALEKLRFGKELEIYYDTKALDFSLPALTVQPIVENAVKHGVGKRLGGGTLIITSREYGDRYEVAVSDSGAGYKVTVPLPEEKRSHIGVENVRTRMRDMCGGDMLVESKDEKGTKVRLVVPKNLMRRKEG